MVNYIHMLNLKGIFYLKYYLLLLLLISQICRADCEQAADSCAKIGEWDFSVSVGAGVTTNPLNGGDNIPLIIVPQISYYGEKVFFETSTLGYTFFETDNLIVSAVTQLNAENAYFSKWHPKNIILDSSHSSLSPGNETDSTDPDNNGDKENEILEVNIDDVPSKDWALDAGVQINWFVNDSAEVKVQLLHNINNVYNGFNGQFEFSQMLGSSYLPGSKVFLSLGANVNSKNLVDYFYGVPEKIGLFDQPIYKGELSINPYFRFEVTHQFAEHWKAKLNIKRVFLGEGTTDSPLVKEHNISTIFAGVTYDF